MTPMEVNDSYDISSLQETADDVPDSCQEPSRKGGDTAKVIIITMETTNYIMGRAHHDSAFVSKRSVIVQLHLIEKFEETGTIDIKYWSRSSGSAKAPKK